MAFQGHQEGNLSLRKRLLRWIIRTGLLLKEYDSRGVQRACLINDMHFQFPVRITDECEL